MYFAGTLYNFENRLHQLPTISSDLDSFRTEACSYTDAAQYIKNKINKEFGKKLLIIELSSIIEDIFDCGDVEICNTLDSNLLFFDSDILTFDESCSAGVSSDSSLITSDNTSYTVDSI